MPAVIDTRTLSVGFDRLCRRCGGSGAYVPATSSLPARAPTRGELAAFARGKGPAERCGHCQGIGLEPGSRVLRTGDAPAEDDSALWPIDGPPDRYGS